MQKTLRRKAQSKRDLPKNLKNQHTCVVFDVFTY